MLYNKNRMLVADTDNIYKIYENQMNKQILLSLSIYYKRIIINNIINNIIYASGRI